MKPVTQGGGGGGGGGAAWWPDQKRLSSVQDDFPQTSTSQWSARAFWGHRTLLSLCEPVLAHMSGTQSAMNIDILSYFVMLHYLTQLATPVAKHPPPK